MAISLILMMLLKRIFLSFNASVPLFSGSPRSLVLAGPLLLGATVGFPGLSVMTGAQLNYRFIARPDVRKACYLWNENVWIAPGDYVPGLDVFTPKTLLPKKTSTAILSHVFYTFH